MKKVLALALTVMLCALALTPRTVEGQDGDRRNGGKPTGKSLRRYRAEQGGPRPAWAESARVRSLEFLKRYGNGAGVYQPADELVFVSALEDDLGQTHVRLGQVHEGVPVFATQVITHADARGGWRTTGRASEAARRVNTTPGLTAASAIKAARVALGYGGDLSEQPTAKLVILPNVDGSDGATLTYQVELFVEDHTNKPQRHQYFVDAHTGAVVWHYDSIPDATGYSLYSGTVDIPTRYSNGAFRMYADGFGACTTRNHDTGSVYQDGDNVWGNGLESFHQTAAVDAHFNLKSTWSYFRDVLGRYGLDGGSRAAHAYVHYGTNVANAYYDDGKLKLGDGDAYSTPWVSTDIVAHEFTHGVTAYAAGLVYSNEPGAANESFSDIFGTVVEFYVGTRTGFGGVSYPADWWMGEDLYYSNDPANPTRGIRNMADPHLEGDPCHYSERYTGTSDNGGVHINSGIMNKMWYLLTNGGTNHKDTTGTTVTGIGMTASAAIAYDADTKYCTATDTFAKVANAWVNAARGRYGAGSTQAVQTYNAWKACGVTPTQLP